ncbi:MAG: MBL fold metallo-hydrolase [Gammaproteobacteria bacterium]|nr:MBL fold metallo-hydrolase [Gammaproteobacteria bacterium]
MRFSMLGSGSKGNATLVQSGTTTVMVDCGFTIKETERRLQRLNVKPAEICAILVTHEHGDHISGVGPFARKYHIPVHMTRGSWVPHRMGNLPQHHIFCCHSPFEIGELTIQPFPVPHDAREACQFTFRNNGKKLGILTDTGKITPHIEESLDGCDALILETNHDLQMLRDGPYPPSLQARVGGDLGHLSNQQSAALLEKIETGRLQHLVIAHLSEQNNLAEHAISALSTSGNYPQEQIAVADQEQGLSWCEISE